MPVEVEADRQTIVGDWDTLTAGAASVSGYFGNAFAETLETEGTAPSFTLTTADAVANSLTYGVAVSVSSVNYLVRTRADDGHGMTVLTLETV